MVEFRELRKIRSPLEYQASLCRTLEELNPIELHIAKILTDPQFIDRMLQLFIHDTDEKNTNLFFLCFFCVIFPLKLIS